MTIFFFNSNVHMFVQDNFSFPGFLFLYFVRCILGDPLNMDRLVFKEE